MRTHIVITDPGVDASELKRWFQSMCAQNIGISNAKLLGEGEIKEHREQYSDRDSKKIQDSKVALMFDMELRDSEVELTTQQEALLDDLIRRVTPETIELWVPKTGSSWMHI